MRRRLVYSALAVAAATGAAFVYINPIMQFLKRPLGDVELVFTQVTEGLGVTFSLGLTVGIAAALPIILLQAILFVTPALYPREKALVYALLPAVVAAFAGGVAFSYLVLLPPALKFLVQFGSEIATPFISIGNYMSLVQRLLFWVGIVFETPVVMFILARIGIVTAGKLVRMWRLALVASFLVGAIITPTFDPVNQVLVAGPIMGLYGLSILLAYVAQAGRRKRQAPLSEE